MLTGDNAGTAQALARQAGVGAVEADLLPTDKAAAVERLEAASPTAMVGDGINDAPALATATVGIAMGAIGNDVAIETADVSLMGDDLRHLPETFGHARRAGAIMGQNLFLSRSILAVLVPLAAAGVLGLATVVAITSWPKWWSSPMAYGPVVGAPSPSGRRRQPGPLRR
jgi:cation-transporting ATPase G